MHMRKGLCNRIAEPGWLQKKNASPAYGGTGSHHLPLLRPGLSWRRLPVLKITKNPDQKELYNKVRIIKVLRWLSEIQITIRLSAARYCFGRSEADRREARCCFFFFLVSCPRLALRSAGLFSKGRAPDYFRHQPDKYSSHFSNGEGGWHEAIAE